MTVNELNSKIHLPSLALHLGMRGEYSYVKLPKFGWFGYNPDRSFVFDSISLFEDPNIGKIYKYLTQEKPDFQEYRMFYSEVLENKLVSNYTELLCARKLLSEARQAIETGHIRVQGDNVSFMHAINELGMSRLLYLGIGLLTTRLLKSKIAVRLGLKETLANKIVVPSYCTPGHFASLEAVGIEQVENPDARIQLYLNQEKGWYGELNHSIVGNFKDLLTQRGCTWDRKVDYWTTQPVELKETLSTQECIQIWSQSRNLVCRQSPLDIIKANNAIHMVKDHLKELTLTQVRELEKVTGEKLHNYWVAARSVEAEVCGEKFSCRNDRYYLFKHGEEIEYSNFALKLTKITKEDGEFYQNGLIHFNGTETPFRAKRKAFDQQGSLMKEMNKLFLETGIGVPIIAPNYKHYITAVINAFNPDNPIEVLPTPVQEPTTSEREPECHSTSDRPEAHHSRTQSPVGQTQPECHSSCLPAL